MIDDPLKSREINNKEKRFKCKAYKYEGMGRTYWYASMTEDAVQSSSKLFRKSSKAAYGVTRMEKRKWS